MNAGTPGFDAVLLDFYGTLVEEDDEAIDRIVRQIVGHAPGRPTAREVAGDWNRRFAEACEAAHGAAFRSQREIEQASLRDCAARFGSRIDIEAASAPLFDYWRAPVASPAAAAFLASLRVPCCIVSNIDRAYLDDAIEHHGWAFEHVVTSECARAYKPRPEMFQQAGQRLGVPLDRVLHVGDSWGSDVTGAGRLGIVSAWINPRSRTAPDAAMKPAYDVRNLSELRSRLVHTRVCQAD